MIIPTEFLIKAKKYEILSGTVIALIKRNIFNNSMSQFVSEPVMAMM